MTQHNVNKIYDKESFQIKIPGVLLRLQLDCALQTHWILNTDGDKAKKMQINCGSFSPKLVLQDVKLKCNQNTFIVKYDFE